MKGKSAERPANDAVAKDILAGLAEAQRGDFATEDEVAAVIAKYVKRAHIAIASTRGTPRKGPSLRSG
jgi:hypothetical protein